MNRDQLERIVRAACRITGEPELLVIGSQAILGSFSEEELPAEAIRSIEADLAAFDDPDDLKADQIDRGIGEDSQFHATFGVYGQGVSVSTAVLPAGWRDRLVRLDTDSGAGLCLEKHDLVLSKLARGDTRDYEYASSLVRNRLVETEILANRLERLPVGALKREEISVWLRKK